MNEDVILDALCEKQLSNGKSLLKELEENDVFNVKGVGKLALKIKKEISVINKRRLNKSLKKEHLVCSNLNFLNALVQEVKKQNYCEAVLETFSYKSCGENNMRLTVDIISLKGQRWVKVIARKPLALHQIFTEGGKFGQNCIMDQGEYYLQVATQNLHLFQPPQVVFSFAYGVPEKMKVYLESLGILVEGKTMSFENDLPNNSSDRFEDENYSDLKCFSNINPPTKQISSPVMLNLCVSTMIAYVSSLTNGGCHYEFEDTLLNQQAEWERAKPVKPILENLFQGKELICCRSAVEDFKRIVDIVGGTEEKCRANTFLKCLKIVPEVSFSNLNASGKIKRRSLLIFGTGHEYKAVTVTANKGFVLAAKQKERVSGYIFWDIIRRQFGYQNRLVQPFG